MDGMDGMDGKDVYTMEGRKRTLQIKFRVTQEERNLIEQLVLFDRSFNKWFKHVPESRIGIETL